MSTAGKTTEFSLKILVDKQRNKVTFAEADSSFVDVLFSFMTLPMGTIIKLVEKNSDSMPLSNIGSFNSLYEGLVNLPSEYFWMEECKLMLLHPRNSSEAHCRKLKLNVDDSKPTKYFICENWECSRQYSGASFTNFKTAKCSCGKLMNREIKPPSISEISTNQHTRGVFVNGSASFLITDDLCVLPNSVGSSVQVLSDLGFTDMRFLEERIIPVGLKEVLELLKLALLSKSPLTTLFLRKTNTIDDPVMPDSRIFTKLPTCKVLPSSSKKIDIKVVVQKSNGKPLFIQSGEDFIDFLFSFLTIPLGNVACLLSGSTGMLCIDKLYRSITNLSVGKYILSQDIRDMLLNPQLGQHYVCKNKVFTLQEASSPKYYFYSNILTNGECTGNLEVQSRSYLSKGERSVRMTFKDPKLNNGFVAGPAVFMVMDNLVLTPLSSFSSVSFLYKLKVPFTDVEEHEVSIGVEEGLGILKASLTSSSALSCGLNLLLKKPKQELSD